MRKLLIGVLYFITLAPSFSQNSDPQEEFGNWNAWINSLVFSQKWKFDSDLHVRTWLVGKDPNTLILRSGLTYVALPWLELTAGYGYFEFYPYQGEDGWEANGTEHRLHQQVFAKHTLSKFFFNHRLRLEERLIQTPEKKRFQRPRYRFLVGHPLTSKLYTFGTYEHFWTLSDWKFDQGRLHLGLGHSLGKHAKLELAYLRHFLKNSTEFNRLQINFISTLKLNSE